jgi:uncharacterized membrane protein
MPGLPKLKDFLQGMKDDPKSTVLYIAFIAIVALFGILRASDKSTSARQDRELVECRASASANALTSRVENEQMRDKLIEVMGALKEVQGEMNTLRKLGIIK